MLFDGNNVIIGVTCRKHGIRFKVEAVKSCELQTHQQSEKPIIFSFERCENAPLIVNGACSVAEKQIL